MQYVVSYPRSGSHWLNLAMELYFGVQRRIDISGHRLHLVEEGTPLWTHTHCVRADGKDVIYLHRDPVDAIHGHMALVMQNTYQGSIGRMQRWVFDGMIETFAKTNNATHCKHLNAAHTVIAFDDLKEHPDRVAWKICSHFHVDCDAGRFADCLSRITVGRLAMQSMAAERGRNFKPFMLSDAYRESREQFRAEWQDRIYEISLTGVDLPYGVGVA